MPGGRPTKYNLVLAEKICGDISSSESSLGDICRSNQDYPDVATVYRWRYSHPEFCANYVRAKQQQAEFLAESIDSIALEKHFYIDADGNQRIDSGFVADKRLRIDTRKWIASKLLPKVYGDKVQTETKVTITYEDALKELE